MMTLKKNSYSVFILTGFIFVFNLVDAADTIVINTTGKPPLNDARNQGFMDLIAFEAFSRIDVKLETVQLPAERGLINANAGIIDGEMSRIAGLSSRYTNLIKVDEKIMDWEFVAYSNQNVDLHNGWDSLIPYSVSIINGWKILENNIPIKTNLTKVKNTEQLFTMLKLKRTDLIIYEKWGGLKYITEKKITSLKLINPPLIIKEMFIYLHVKHQGLVSKLASALKAMKKDGSYSKIKNKTLINSN